MHFSDELTTTIADLEKERLTLLEKRDNSIIWHFAIPIVLAMTALVATLHPGPGMLALGLSAIISGIIYAVRIGSPFNGIKAKLKAGILKEFMDTYHPDVRFRYFADKQDVRQISRESDLVSANRYSEEDVIKGNYGATEFYISEVHLSRKKKKSTVTVFDGLLFKLKIPGKQFPRARIQNRPGLLTRMFGGYIEHPEYGFHYDTDNPYQFEEELGNLFPFIRHLMEKQGDVRISVKGDEITMFMNSDMKFLDDPRPSIKKSFHDKEYLSNFGRQLNTLLFIVESLSNNVGSQEIEERLELRALEVIEKIERGDMDQA